MRWSVFANSPAVQLNNTIHLAYDVVHNWFIKENQSSLIKYGCLVTYLFARPALYGVGQHNTIQLSTMWHNVVFSFISIIVQHCFDRRVWLCIPIEGQIGIFGYPIPTFHDPSFHHPNDCNFNVFSDGTCN